MVKYSDHFIYLPSTAEEMDKISQEFEAVANFPNVLLCIDGSHVPVRRPSGIRGAPYINRKGFSSVNVLVGCDSNDIFRYVNATHPGSVHDSTVFKRSQVSITENNDDFYHIRWHLIIHAH